MNAPTTLRCIGSMATRGLMQALAADYSRASGVAVSVEAVGGVDAARHVAAGAPFDVVVLASDAIGRLAAAGKIDAAQRRDLVRSGVAVAVRAGSAPIDIASEDDVRRAVLAAGRIALSTGPSGVALMALFQRWGILETLDGRLVKAQPGVPVGQLIAQGEASLGFQQLSELMGLGGITVLGPLPPAIQIVTTFSAAPVSAGTQADAAADLLAFMASDEAAAAKRRHGMEPV